MSDEDGVLEGTVSDVKEAIKGLKDPDYRDLLKREKEGKDRKGVKEFLESKIDYVVSDDETESNEEGFMDSRYAIIGTGLVFGLLIGLIAGQAFAGSSVNGDRQVAKENVRQLVESGGFNGTVDVGEPTVRNGMYYFNVSLTAEGPNGTSRTNHQTAYVTTDGQLLFPERPLMGIPVNIEQAIQRQNQQPQPSPNPNATN